METSIYIESPHFSEFLELSGLEVMGNVDVRLACGEILHIEDAFYADKAKYNLISVQSLREQKMNPMGTDSNYCLRTFKNQLYLFDENDGELLPLTRKVANRSVLMTRDPTIKEVIAHAVSHQIPESKKAWIKELDFE